MGRLREKFKPHKPVVLNRETVAAGIGTFVIVVLVGILGWYTANNTAETADTKGTKALAAAVKVQDAIIARNTAANRANAVAIHATCLRTNDSRNHSRQVTLDTVAIVFNAQLPGARERTAEQILALAAIQRKVEERSLELLPPINCNKVAPLPPHPTKAEIDSLPKPTPIPPLKP